MRGSIFHRHYGYRPGVGPGAGAQQTYAQYVATLSGLVGWYRFNEADGVTLVNHGSAGADINGTLTADNVALVRPADGPLGAGEAWDFTVANNGVVTLPAHAALTGLTTQTWLFLMNLRSTGENGNGTYARVALTAWRINYTTGATLDFNVPHATTNAVLKIAPPGTGVRGYAFEYNATTKALRIVLLESGAMVVPAPVVTPTTGSGNYVPPSSAYSVMNNSLNSAGMDCLLDELLIFNRIPTDEEYGQLAKFFT